MKCLKCGQDTFEEVVCPYCGFDHRTILKLSASIVAALVLMVVLLAIAGVYVAMNLGGE